MAIPPRSDSIDYQLPRNFPRPPGNRSTTSLLTHPRDLLGDNNNSRPFYIQIQFVEYSVSLVASLNGPSEAANPWGGVVLPLPMKINDTLPIIWSEISLTSAAAQATLQAAYISALNNGLRGRLAGRFTNLAQFGSLAAGAVSVASGYQLNPSLWMMFERPGFKEFQLQWQLTAYDEQESHNIANIIHYFKRESLPGTTAGGLLYTYPSIALIRMYPDDFFTHRFRPCAVVAVNTDFTGAGSPSFHKSGAPTVTNLTLAIKEIDLWTKTNYWAGSNV